MNNSKYRGVVVPMVTPVTQDGLLDIKAVERIIDFFAENKVSPLLMGTTGEGNSVSQADGQLFVETAVKAARSAESSAYSHSIVHFLPVPKRRRYPPVFLPQPVNTASE